MLQAYTLLMAPMRATCPAYLILPDSVTLISGAVCKLCSSSSQCSPVACCFPSNRSEYHQHPVLKHPLPLGWKTKFHAHTKKIYIYFLEVNFVHSCGSVHDRLNCKPFLVWWIFNEIHGKLIFVGIYLSCVQYREGDMQYRTEYNWKHSNWHTFIYSCY
jgi:hypothetical protein